MLNNHFKLGQNERLSNFEKRFFFAKNLTAVKLIVRLKKYMILKIDISPKNSTIQNKIFF